MAIRGIAEPFARLIFFAIGKRYAKQQFPAEFHRGPRSFAEYVHFKASEKRAIMLYGLEFFVLKFVRPEVANLILYLCAAYRIISDPNLACNSDLLDLAQSLFELFLACCVTEFGDHFVTLNVHLLSHITDDARRRGSVENHSCFKFENALKRMKGMCRNGFKNTMVTMTNRLAEDFVFESNIGKQVFFEKPQVTTRGGQTSVKYRDLIYSAAPPNCYVGTASEIYRIAKIEESDDSHIVLLCDLFRRQRAWKISRICPPVCVDSTCLGIYKISLLPVQHRISLLDVTQKYVYVSYETEGDVSALVYPLMVQK